MTGYNTFPELWARVFSVGNKKQGVAYLSIKLESLQAIRPAVIDRLPMSLADLHKGQEKTNDKTFISVVSATKNAYVNNSKLYRQVKSYFSTERKSKLDGWIASVEKTLSKNASEAAKSSQLEEEKLDVLYKEYIAILLVMLDFNINFVQFLDQEIDSSIEQMSKISP